MTLREKQSIFVLKIARLIAFADSMGYALTFGEAWRPPEMVAIYAKRGTGSRKSLHPDRLAIDLNLFKGGKWLTATEAHRPLGRFWESLSDDQVTCVWGGSWGDDGNHYSIEHQGRK